MPPGVAVAGAGGSGAPDVLKHELVRLRDELKLKDAAIEERAVEVHTLTKQLRLAQDAVAAAEAGLAAAQDRRLTAEGEAASLRKHLAAAAAERDALVAEVDSSRAGALRARDKELEELGAQAAAAEAAQLRARELESAVKELRAQLRRSEEEVATLQRQQQAAAEEVAEARREADKSNRELASASDYLAGIMSELAMAQDQLQTVRHQNKTLQEDLSRAEGEAARHAVAAAEAKAAAAAALKPRPEDGAATAALQQALQQLSLRTAEVVELKKRLDGAAAAGSSASTAAGGEAAEGLRSAGSSGPATPVVAAAGEGVATIVAHAALSADGGSMPASPSAAAVPQAAAAQAAVEASLPDDVAASSPRAVAAQASEAAPGSSGGNELVGAPHALDSSEEAAAAGDVPSIAEPAAEAVATPAAAAVGEVVTAAADGTVANGPSPAAAAAAGDLPQDLQAAHQQIVELQQRVAQLQQELAAAAAGHSDEEEESDEEHHSTPRGPASPSAAAPQTALSPAEVAAEERRRNAERGQRGSIWLGGKRPDHLGGATPLTKEALANIIDKLLQSREEQREAAAAAATAAQRRPAPRMSPSGGLAAFVGGEPLASPTSGAGPASDDGSTGGSVGGRNDTALWEEATAMLRGELIRLGREAAQKMEENERLRSEVGELKTARFSAEAMAARLEEMNALSIRVASLKLELAALKSEQDIREDELLGQIASLQDQLAKKKKKRSPGRMLRKAAEGIRHALDGTGGRQSASEASSAAPSPVPPPVSAEAGSDSEARGSWGGLKSKLSGLGRRASEQ